jgi:Tfp pilus assembly protein PilF
MLGGCRSAPTRDDTPLTQQHDIAARAGNMDKARALEDSILARGGGDLDTYQRLRRSYAFAGHFEDARRVMQRALTAMPNLSKADQAQVHRLIAADSFAQGDNEAAITEFEIAFEMAPEDPQVLNDFAFFLVDTEKDIPRGLDLARRSVAARPDRPEARDTMGWALCKAGRYREAVEQLKQALELYPDNSEVLLHLGIALEGMGDKPAAIEHLVRCLETARPSDASRKEAAARLLKLDPKAYSRATSVMGDGIR